MAQDEITKNIGPYTLVVRRLADSLRYGGVIWREGKIKEKVFKAQGDSLEDVFSQLEGHRAELVAAQLQAYKMTNPTAELARRAFVALAPDMPANRLKMLRAHHQGPDQRITARQLAEAAGYKNYGAANLQYGLLAAAFWEQLPTNIDSRKDGTLIWTFALADAGNICTGNEEEWVWKLKPYVAEGLELSGLL